MSNKTLPRGNPLPVNFKQGRQWDSIEVWQKIPWFDRIRILLGANVAFRVKCISQHSPGRVAMGVVPIVTPYTAAQLKQNPTLIAFPPDNPEETKVVDGVEMQKAN